MKVRRTWSRIRGSVYHVLRGQPYHRENSIRGVRAARKARKRGIDLDLQMSKPCPKPGEKDYAKGCKDPDCIGHVMGTHWGDPLRRDGFRDPLGKIKKAARIRDLYVWEIRRLVAVDRGRVYRIQPIENLLRECAKQGIVAVLEPKGDRRFEQEAVWQRIAKFADSVGAHLAGYSIRDLGGPGAGVRRTDAMRAAGIDAHPIH